MSAAEIIAVMEAAINGAVSQPVNRRILTYQGLAEICGNPKENEVLLRMAVDLAEADRRCREFTFSTAPAQGLIEKSIQRGGRK